MKSKIYKLFFIFLLFSFEYGNAQKVTWTDLTPLGWQATFKKIAISKGGRIFSVADNGWIYQSLDTARTWKPYYNGFPDQKGYYNISNYDGIVTDLSLNFYTDSIHGIYIGNRYNMVNTGHIISFTLDGGITWQNTQTDFNNYQLRGFCWKTKDSAFITAFNQSTYETYVFVTANSGKNWKQTTGQLTDPNYLFSTNTNYQIYFASPSQGYALSQGFYGETKDGGLTWSRVVLPTLNTEEKLQFSNGQTLITTDTVRTSFSFPHCRFINIPNKYNIAPKQLTDLGAGKVCSVGATINDNEFQVSIDSGKTWTHNVFKTKPINSIFPTGILFLNPKTGVMVIGASSAVTNDGGNTWSLYYYGAGGGDFQSMYCKSKDEIFLLGTSGRLFRSTNGGQSWTFQDVDTIGLQHMEFPTKDTGYISLNNRIQRTIDAGQHWTAFATGNNGDDMHFVSKDIGYVGASGTWGEYYESTTTDGGQTWNTIWGDTAYDNTIGQGGSTYRLNGEGLITGSKGLLYTPDGGNSWQSKAMGLTGAIYDAGNGNWLVTNNKGVYTCDKDINCKQTFSDNYYYYIHCGNLLKLDSNTLMFGLSATELLGIDTLIHLKELDLQDTVIISKDGGNTWNKEIFHTPGGFLSIGDSKTVYSIISNPVSFYKGIIQTPTTVSLTQTGNRTISCTVVTNPPSSFPASIVLMKNDSVYYQSSVTIQSGTAFTITIPSSIAAGSGYSIKVIPTDTITYAPAQSSVFSIATAVPIIGNSPVIRVVDKSIVCDCTNFTVYNYLGQKMYPTNLPIGFYFVQVGNSVQKVIIKE